MSNIYFDMDGTIADLYGVENWLEKILEENESPFIEALPLCDMDILSNFINETQAKGYSVGVITWSPLNARKEYKLRVKRAKEKWLATHLPDVEFDNIHVISYGVPKAKYNEYGEDAILFDDDREVLSNWNGQAELVVNPNNLLEKMEKYMVFRNLELG